MAIAPLMSDSGAGRLHAEQLKERADKDVDARRENIYPQEFVPVRAAPLGKAVEHADELLQKELELSRHVLEPGDHKEPADQTEHDQNARHDVGGNKPRIHLGQTEEAHLVLLVQHRVAHDLLDRLTLPAA